MRKSARAMVLVFLTLLSSIALGVVAALTAALTLAATALIVPGTGTHNINPPNAVVGYKENARDRFMTTTPCVGVGCNLIGVDYPATFFPLGFPPFPANWCPGLSCKTWNDSVGEGVTNLSSALAPFITNPDPANPVVIFGYSQGGAVVSHEMYKLANLPQSTKDTITVVTIGNIENPQGLWSRLSFLPTIPILNITFGPQLPTNIGIKSYNYAFEYDPVGDAPLWIGNPLALLNALAAFQYVHGNYLVPNSNAPDDVMPYGYDNATLAAAISNAANIRTYQDATFILIPQQGTLPIFQPLADALPSVLSKPIIDLLSPVTKVLIDTAYNRAANPGIPQTFQLLPTWVNPIQLGVDLVAAGIQGVSAFINDLGGIVPLTTLAPTTLAPTTLAPTTPTTLSTLAAPQQLSLTLETKPKEPQENTKNSLSNTGGNLLTPTKPLTLALTEPQTPTVKSGNLFTPGSTTQSQSQSQSQGTTQPSTTGTTTTGTTTTNTTTTTTQTGTTTPASGTPSGSSEQNSAPAAA